MFFVIEEAKQNKKIFLNFSQGTARVLQIYFASIQYQYNTYTQYNTLNVKCLIHDLISKNREQKMVLKKL